MGGWVLLVAGGLLVGGASAADGAENALSACHFDLIGSGKVVAVRDGRSFTLDDGREVRLAGLEVPPLPAAGETGAWAAAGAAARSALEAIIAGQTVELRQQVAASDRYGRLVAHVYFFHDGTEHSAGDDLLAQGYARVSAQIGDKACAAEFLAREQAARAQKLGLWREPYYVVLGAEGRQELLAQRGRFAIVEGRVVSVRESGGTIYVNFGRHWADALTVTILKRDARIFSAAGLEPKRLANRLVRVRGWVEERNGPSIEATHPEQIEFAERN